MKVFQVIATRKVQGVLVNTTVYAGSRIVMAKDEDTAMAGFVYDWQQNGPEGDYTFKMDELPELHGQRAMSGLN